MSTAGEISQPRRATAAIALARLVKTLQRERRQIERNGFVLRKQRGDFTQHAGKLKAMLPNVRAVAALAPPELFGHNLYGRVKTENPVSSRKAVNLPVVACIGAHYLGKPVFLCEKQHFYSGNSL